jgi:hypothetical protein
MLVSLNFWNKHMISKEPIFTHTGKWTSTMALYSGTKQSTVHMAYSTFSHWMQLLYSLQTKAYIFYRKFFCFIHITIQPTGKVVHSTLNYSELSYYHLDFTIMVVPKVDHQVYEMYTLYLNDISNFVSCIFQKISYCLSTIFSYRTT